MSTHGLREAKLTLDVCRLTLLRAHLRAGCEAPIVRVLFHEHLHELALALLVTRCEFVEMVVDVRGAAWRLRGLEPLHQGLLPLGPVWRLEDVSEAGDISVRVFDTIDIISVDLVLELLLFGWSQKVALAELLVLLHARECGVLLLLLIVVEGVVHSYGVGVRRAAHTTAEF